MIRIFSIIAVWLLPMVVNADVVVPTRTIRAHAIITPLDVSLKAGLPGDTFSKTVDVIGQEAKTTLYAGRPIRVDDIGPPAMIERNQIVSIKFQSAGLLISTEGRSLQRGGVGDQIRIMNLTSRATLFGQVQPDGTIRVFR